MNSSSASTAEESDEPKAVKAKKTSKSPVKKVEEPIQEKENLRLIPSQSLRLSSRRIKRSEQTKSALVKKARELQSRLLSLQKRELLSRNLHWYRTKRQNFLVALPLPLWCLRMQMSRLVTCHPLTRLILPHQRQDCSNSSRKKKPQSRRALPNFSQETRHLIKSFK